MSPATMASGLLAAGVVLALTVPSPASATRVVTMIDRQADPRRTSCVVRVGPHRLATLIGTGLACVGRLVRRRAGRAEHAANDRRLGAAMVVALGAVVINPVLVVPAVGVVWAVPVLRQRAGHRRQQSRLLGEIPDLTELFRLAVGAGLTVHQAVDAVGTRAPVQSAVQLADVASRVAVGHRLADALDRFGAGNEAFRPLASALASAERYGVALGPTLDRLADDARLQRRRQAEELARRLPVQMLFPLVLCILPAFALLTVVPLVLTAVAGLAH